VKGCDRSLLRIWFKETKIVSDSLPPVSLGATFPLGAWLHSRQFYLTFWRLIRLSYAWFVIYVDGMQFGLDGGGCGRHEPTRSVHFFSNPSIVYGIKYKRI
jgi:hypothetical protein